MTDCQDSRAASTTLRASSALMPNTPPKPSLSLTALPRLVQSIVESKVRSSSDSSTRRHELRLCDRLLERGRRDATGCDRLEIRDLKSFWIDMRLFLGRLACATFETSFPARRPSAGAVPGR